MKSKVFELFCCVVLLCSGCASKKQTAPALVPGSYPSPEAQAAAGRVNVDVLDHKGAALGISYLPVWVQTYLDRGIPGLEALPDFDGYYCFVGEHAGKDLKTVTEWIVTYNMTQDIAAAVSSRVNALFARSTPEYPPVIYGPYYETAVTAAANARYSETLKINDWWLFARRYEPGKPQKYTDEYRGYVLYTIDKKRLNRQILTIMNQVISATDAGQQRAIDTIRTVMEREGL